MPALDSRPSGYSRLKKPVSHRLMEPVKLPLGQILAQTRFYLSRIGLGRSPRLDQLTHDLVIAAMHHYFVDAEARRWNDIWDHRMTQVVVDATFGPDLLLQLINDLHRLLRDTTGPLMPSYIYRFEMEGDTLILLPSQPTIDDHEERIRDMANPEEGWIPYRYRR